MYPHEKRLKAKNPRKKFHIQHFCAACYCGLQKKNNSVIVKTMCCRNSSGERKNVSALTRQTVYQTALRNKDLCGYL